MGKILAQRKVFPLAVHYLTEAARELKRDVEIPVTLAEIHAASGQSDKAMEEYRRALSLEPGNEKAQLGIAIILMERKELDLALAELKKAELVSPQNQQIHLLKAKIYEKKGDPKSVEYESMIGGKARKNVPVSPTPEKPVAVTEDSDKTILSLKSAIKDSPDDAVEKYEQLGNLYKAAGKDAEAIVAYKDAIYHKSANSDIYLNLGILYEKQGHLDEAVVAYKQAVKLKPGNADARLRLAEIRNERGFVQEAVEHYSEFLKLKPESPDIQLKLARIFAKSKENTLALNAYNSVLKQVPDNTEANREIANLYKLKDMDEKAIEHYKRVLTQQKDDLETRGALVSLYVKNRKYEEITQLLKDTAELFPEEPNNHYKLGLIYEFRKDFEMALNSYKKTVELKSDHARALNAIGRLHMKNGNYTEAKEALEAARKADPNLEETAVLLNNIRDDFNPEPRKISKKSRSSKAKKSSKKAKAGKSPKKKKNNQI
jgi:tetratricopeptide (TPR) repeat protein